MSLMLVIKVLTTKQIGL